MYEYWYVKLYNPVYDYDSNKKKFWLNLMANYVKIRSVAYSTQSYDKMKSWN